MIALALGGTVEKMTNLNGRPLFIGKEEINVIEEEGKRNFFDLKCVKSVLYDTQKEVISRLSPFIV